VGGKPRARKTGRNGISKGETAKLLRLEARPRVAPLWWPHTIRSSFCATKVDTETGVIAGNVQLFVDYRWVVVRPSGAGWTLEPDQECFFPEVDLDDVLEGFYESTAGPYPFDFRVIVVE